MMEKTSTTMMLILVVGGLIVGAGVGYILKPTKIEVETKTTTVEKNPLDGKTVTLGYIGSSDFERDQSFVEDLIVEEIKAYVDSLGIDVTFEWIFKDALEHAPTHQAMVEELHSEGVDIFIGGSWSIAAELALDYVNENDMLMVSPSSTILNLQIEDDNLFRFAPVDLVQVKALAHMMMSWGIEHAFVLDDFSWQVHVPSREEGWYEIFKETYESLGGEIIERTLYNVIERELYNDIVGTFLSGAIEAYGADRVGVASFTWRLPDVIRDAADSEHLGDVIWMSILRENLEYEFPLLPGGQQTKLRMFTPYPSTSVYSRWSGFEADFERVVGGSPDIWDGFKYDAVWCLALSILQAGSADPMKVKEVLPDVAANYYGVTGGCALNSAGDREPHIYDIWGYAKVEGEHTYIKYGEYDAQTDEVQWYDSALSSQNLTRPGS